MVSHSFTYPFFTPPTEPCFKHRRLWGSALNIRGPDAYVLKATLPQALPVGRCHIPHSARLQMSWAQTLLPPRSQRSWSLMSWHCYLQVFWPQWRIFWSIYATWMHSHLEMVARVAITPSLMIHFYILLTCHPQHQQWPVTLYWYFWLLL